MKYFLLLIGTAFCFSFIFYLAVDNNRLLNELDKVKRGKPLKLHIKKVGDCKITIT